MGQNGSHHEDKNNARSVKHRRSTRSLPGAQHITDDDKAYWDAYRKGVYKTAAPKNVGLTGKTVAGPGVNGQQPTGVFKAPYGGPPSLKSGSGAFTNDLRAASNKALGGGGGDLANNGVHGRPACSTSLQNFSSFEKHYLAQARSQTTQQNRSNISENSRRLNYSYSKPMSDVGLTTYKDVGQMNADRVVKDRRGAPVRDDTWSDVASDLYRANSKKRDYKSNPGRRERKHNKGDVESRWRYQSSTLDRVPETSYSDDMLNDDIDVITEEEDDEADDVITTRSDFVVTSSKRAPPISGKDVLKSSKSCYTNLKEGGGYERGRNKAIKGTDRLIIESLKRELYAERTLRQNLEDRTRKDQETIQKLRKQVEKFKCKVEQLNVRLDDREFKYAVGNEDGKLKRLQELLDENERLKRDNDGLKVNLEYRLEEVARAFVNGKLLESECVQLQKRVLELEWQQKSTPTESTAKDEPLVQTTSDNSKTPFNSVEKESKNRYPTVALHHETEYTELYSNGLAISSSASSPSKFNVRRRLRMQNELRLDQLIRDSDQSSPMSQLGGGGGGEALCSRPSSFNFDAAAIAASSMSNGNESPLKKVVDSNNREIVVNFMRYSDLCHVTSILNRVQCSAFVEKFVKKLASSPSDDCGYFSTVSTADSGDGRPPQGASPSLAKIGLALTGQKTSTTVTLKRYRSVPLVVSASLLPDGTRGRRATLPKIRQKIRHVQTCPKINVGEILSQFLSSSRSDLTEFERDCILTKLEEVTVPREALCERPDFIAGTQNVEQKTTDDALKRMENDYVECIEESRIQRGPESCQTSNYFKDSKQGAPRRNIAHNLHYTTSDDSSEYYGEKSLIKERWNQLKRKKNSGKLAVVRYKPNTRRSGTVVPNSKASCFSKNRAFHRFGRQERQALACFDFLFERRFDDSPPPVVVQVQQVAGGEQQEVVHNDGIYENLAYHNNNQNNSSNSYLFFDDDHLCVSSSTDASFSSLSSTSLHVQKILHKWPPPHCSAAVSLGGKSSSSSRRLYQQLSSSDSSLFLSQWNLAAESMDDDHLAGRSSSLDSNDQSFSSGSSI